jgi:hypothetical protein
MKPRNPNFSAYRQAQLKARARAWALRLQALGRLDEALWKYATTLEKRLAALPAGPAQVTRRLAAERSLQITQQMAADLADSLGKAVAEGRDVAFEDILKIQTDASLAVAQSVDVPDALLGAVVKPNLTLAGAWESLGAGSATWKTLLKGYVQNAAQETQQIVTQALLEGVSPAELSRRLRPYVLGAEPFQKAFQGAGAITDKMLRDPLLTGEAKRLRYNADRIAFSEIHNARGEAEIQAFAADPFVKAVAWRLSPNRGKIRRRDACDGLASTNYYGLGPGVYPVMRVPTSPHPFCRCERVPISRPLSEIHQPKPDPPLQQQQPVLGTGCPHG